MNPEPDKNTECSWFENWFDSTYYHILYGNHDKSEAERFMESLLAFLKLQPGARIHDLACGKGRHSVFLNSKGYEVVGTDLSGESIAYAMQFENEKLSFFRSDMRNTIRVNYFDCVFNLFTSFGYFGTEREHREVIRAVHSSLKPGGIFVLDYLNTSKILKELVPEQTKEAEGILFHIQKEQRDGYIIKNIQFSDRGKEYHFQEKVRAFSLAELKALFLLNGFELLHLKGDYSLSDFSEQSSDRLILIGKKLTGALTLPH
jgi:SAM-dependent methyltransferase